MSRRSQASVPDIFFASGIMGWKKMIDLQYATKKFPSYARKVRIGRLVVASRRRHRHRAFNINRAA